MSDPIHTKVLIIGGGPGGYVAGIRCGQLGLDAVLVESHKLGGTCLNVGCIPSKAVIHSAGYFETMTRAASDRGLHGIKLAAKPALSMPELVAWKDSVTKKLNSGVAALLKRAKVRVVEGWATFSDAKTCTVKTKDGEQIITADHVILANGSKSVELPFLPFGDKVISSTEALELSELPKKLVVVGAGYIGLELGIAFRKLGSGVTIVEAMDRILPLYDADLVAPVAKWLKTNGVTVHLSAKAKGEDKRRPGGGGGGGTTTAPSAAKSFPPPAARNPATDGWGLEKMG